MNLFKGLEKQVSVGVFLAHGFISSALAANKGWGAKADEWVEGATEGLAENRDRVKDLAADVEAGFDDFLEATAERIMTYLDAKYVPSAEEQASASNFNEDEDAPANFVDVDDFVNSMEKVFTEEPAEEEEPVVSSEEVKKLIAERNFVALRDLIAPYIAQVVAARADNDEAKAATLVDALRKSGVAVIFKGERVTWHLI